MIKLDRNGKFPDLSRFTAKNILVVGERAMRGHLERVTDKLAKRHSRAPGATGAGAPAKITGGGIKRLQEADVVNAGGEVYGVIPLTQAMAVHEFGEVIKAKGAGYLTVPLPAALNPDGTPKKPSALLWKKARVIKSRRGNLLIAVRNGRAPFALEPFQLAFLKSYLAREADGPVYRTAIYSTPRKLGKSKDVVPNAERLDPEPGNPGVFIRTLLHLLLVELSLVTRPAYEASQAELRAMQTTLHPVQRERIILP